MNVLVLFPGLIRFPRGLPLQPFHAEVIGRMQQDQGRCVCETPMSSPMSDCVHSREKTAPTARSASRSGG